MQRKHICTLIKFQINITILVIFIEINFIFNNLLKLYLIEQIFLIDATIYINTFYISPNITRFH